MVRPRARRKIRNPHRKVSRSAKNPYKVSFNNVHPLIRENWDKDLTLRQNYERLGLLPTLNGAAGGIGNEVALRKLGLSASGMKIKAWDDEEEMDAEEGTTQSGWRVGNEDDHMDLAREAVERGAVEMRYPGQEAAEDEEEEDDDEEVLERIAEPDERALGIGQRIGHKRLASAVSLANTTATPPQPDSLAAKIIKALEEEVANAGPAVERKPSEQETYFMLDLVRKYGSDYEKMARDRKLNPYQLTAGQLRKKCEKVLKRAGSA
ncbi:Nucleolar protein 16 [Quaeritorhiza haematococci]|nr:Nucleolar protein 16 [Quaeritorhiza haematococci]